MDENFLKLKNYVRNLGRVSKINTRKSHPHLGTSEKTYCKLKTKKYLKNSWGKETNYFHRISKFDN